MKALNALKTPIAAQLIPSFKKTERRLLSVFMRVQSLFFGDLILKLVKLMLLEGNMKFRLTYAGIVKSSGNKPKAVNKHKIRLAFHEQLLVLWGSNPILRDFSQEQFPNMERAIEPDFAATVDEAIAGKEPKKYPYSELLIAKHKLHDVNWHPLVTTESGLISEVDILMLRPNDSKSIVQGGDIDGRVKTIFDALSIPKNGDVLSDLKNLQRYFILCYLMIH